MRLGGRFTQKCANLVEKADQLLKFFKDRILVQSIACLQTTARILLADIEEYSPEQLKNVLRPNEALVLRQDLLRRMDSLMRILDADGIQIWLHKDFAQPRVKLYAVLQRNDLYVVLRQKCPRSLQGEPGVDLESLHDSSHGKNPVPDPSETWGAVKDEMDLPFDEKAFAESQLKLLEFHEEQAKTKRRVSVPRRPGRDDLQTKRAPKDADGDPKEDPDDEWRYFGPI